MELTVIPLGPLSANMYLLQNEGDFYIVDPCVSPKDFTRYTQIEFDDSFSLKAIFVTHAHFDHIIYIEDWVELTGAVVYMHDSEIESLNNPYLNCSQDMFLSKTFNISTKDIFKASELIDGLTVIHTPGHSSGSVCLFFEKDNLLLTGDTLFDGGVGRTDLPNGSDKELYFSLLNLFKIESNPKFYPGHGNSGFLNDEKSFYV